LDHRLSTSQPQELQGAMIGFIHRVSLRSSGHILKIAKTGTKKLDEGHVELSFSSGVHSHYITRQHGKSFLGVKLLPPFPKNVKNICIITLLRNGTERH